MSEPSLTATQRELVRTWLPGAVLLGDHSWGLTDTRVLHLREHGADYTLKCFGPRNHHFERELVGHREFTAPLLPDARVPRLVRADEDARALLLTWLPGRLVEGDPSATEPDTHRQAGELLARLHDQPGRPSTTWLVECRDRTLRWLTHPHRIPSAVVERIRAHDWAAGSVDLVPTHGDLSPRNWVVHEGVVSFIDLGRADLRNWKGWALVVVLAVAAELAQDLAPGRSPRLDDVLLNLAGGMAGIVLAIMLRWIARRL